MSKEKVKQYVFLTILMSVINFCVAGVLIGTTVINLKGAEAAEDYFFVQSDFVCLKN